MAKNVFGGGKSSIKKIYGSGRATRAIAGSARRNSNRMSSLPKSYRSSKVPGIS